MCNSKHIHHNWPLTHKFYSFPFFLSCLLAIIIYYISFEILKSVWMAPGGCLWYTHKQNCIVTKFFKYQLQIWNNLFRHMALILCQTWILFKIVQYILFTVNLNLYNFVTFIILKWFHFSNNLLVVFKKRPTLALYSKAFMNYNLNRALSSLFS